MPVDGLSHTEAIPSGATARSYREKISKPQATDVSFLDDIQRALCRSRSGKCNTPLASTLEAMSFP